MTDEPGKDLAPRQPQPPQPPAPQMDPEQLRQFQEFQRFQEYQRYQEATGQAPQPFKPQGKRWWLVVLGSGIFWRALFFLLVVFSAVWAYNHFFGTDDPGDIAQDSGGLTGAAQGPRTPAGLQGTIGLFYKHVSFADSKRACALFHRPDAAQKFADGFGASDCESAVKDLKTKVKNVDKYQLLIFPPEVQNPPPAITKITIDSCLMTVEGGPRLGTFIVEKIDAGWLITDWSPSTCS
ncbi:hypothetical protein [Lentzea sp. NPDC059081]|uniref:hypothetical protein n=1 Tax=Lentzea sp. NPDC059081 TaxID=3346719 RepID=UPI0036AE9138